MGIGKVVLVNGLPISVRTRAFCVDIIDLKCSLFALKAWSLEVWMDDLESLALSRILMERMGSDMSGGCAAYITLSHQSHRNIEERH